MENDKPEPIDAEVSKTTVFGRGGFGNHTPEQAEKDGVVKAAESILRKNQPHENFVRRLMNRIRGK